jgi:hypothetical protein
MKWCSHRRTRRACALHVSDRGVPCPMLDWVRRPWVCGTCRYVHMNPAGCAPAPAIWRALASAPHIRRWLARCDHRSRRAVPWLVASGVLVAVSHKCIVGHWSMSGRASADVDLAGCAVSNVIRVTRKAQTIVAHTLGLVCDVVLSRVASPYPQPISGFTRHRRHHQTGVDASGFAVQGTSQLLGRAESLHLCVMHMVLRVLACANGLCAT